MSYDVAAKYNQMTHLLNEAAKEQCNIDKARIVIGKYLLQVAQMCQDSHNSKQDSREVQMSQRFRSVCDVSEKETLCTPYILPEVYRNAKDALIDGLEFGVNLARCSTISEVTDKVNKRALIVKSYRQFEKLLSKLDDDDKIDLYTQAIASMKAAKQQLLPKIPELKVNNYVR